MTDLEVEKSGVESPVVGVNSTGISRAKKIGLFAVGLCLCALIGVGVGILLKNLYDNEEKGLELNVSQIIDEADNAIIAMSVDESVDYIDEKIFEYNQNKEIVDRLLVMKMNVFLNGGRPEDVLNVMLEVDDSNMVDETKMGYYMVISKAYGEIGNVEMENYYYYDKYLVIYNAKFSGGVNSDD